jgi:hypothetical protein
MSRRANIAYVVITFALVIATIDPPSPMGSASAEGAVADSGMAMTRTPLSPKADVSAASARK